MCTLSPKMKNSFSCHCYLYGTDVGYLNQNQCAQRGGSEGSFDGGGGGASVGSHNLNKNFFF